MSAVRPRALACPASLKGVLSARAAAAALADGLGRAGVNVDECPVADGGEGTADVLQRALGGDWREATVADPFGRPVEARWLLLPGRNALVEAAEAIGLDRLTSAERDPYRASSRGLGELVRAALAEEPASLTIALGGSATVDGGAGLREVISGLSVRTRVACDVLNPLLGPRGAARAFGPQKGAGPADVELLEARLAAMEELEPVAAVPGAGAAGGLGAALAALGAELVPGAELVLAAVRLRERLSGTSLAITGEGRVDRGTTEGKAPGAVLAACHEEGVRCVVFGGQVTRRLKGVELVKLSGGRERAQSDLRELGERLGASL